MKHLNVMIADANNEALTYNTHSLSQMAGIDVVASTMYGEEVIEKLCTTEVDVLVTDIVLKGIDGIGVLDALRGMKRPMPKPLILTRIDSEEVQAEVISKGASFYMVKPAKASQLYDRICLIGGSCRKAEPVKGLGEYTQTISECLKRMGIPPSVKGYAYLEEAVRLRLEGTTDQKRLTDRTYPKVAERFSTNARCVERALRTAIVSAWRNGALQRYALSEKHMPELDKKPTAGEMIEHLYERARENALRIN